MGLSDGMALGGGSGTSVGLFEGFVDGFALGCGTGLSVGLFEGFVDGHGVGSAIAAVGMELGDTGKREGRTDGAEVAVGTGVIVESAHVPVREIVADM